MALVKCNECGQMISDKAKSCIKCGAPVEKSVYCGECGGEMRATDEICPICGCPKVLVPEEIHKTDSDVSVAPEVESNNTETPADTNRDGGYGLFEDNPTGKKRGLAAIFAFALGGVGVHMFYLGKKGGGVLMLLAYIFGCIFLYIPVVNLFLGLPMLIWLAVTCIIQGIKLFKMSYEEFEDRWIFSNCLIPY